MINVARHPYDGLRRFPHQQSFADRILVAEEALGQRFIDDRDFRRPGSILCSKCSSEEQWYAHRLEIVRTDVIGFNNRLISRLRRRTPFDLKKHADLRAAERRKSRQADRLDTGQGLDARKRFLEIGEAARRFLRVFGEARSERERQYSLRIEALGNGQQAQEALDHKAGADEQDQSQREFGDHPPFNIRSRGARTIRFRVIVTLSLERRQDRLWSLCAPEDKRPEARRRRATVKRSQMSPDRSRSG